MINLSPFKEVPIRLHPSPAPTDPALELLSTDKDKSKDIFKIRKGSLVKGLIGSDGKMQKVLEVSEVTDLSLRADSTKFRVGFRTANNKLWSITEKSAVEFFHIW